MYQQHYEDIQALEKRSLLLEGTTARAHLHRLIKQLRDSDRITDEEYETWSKALDGEGEFCEFKDRESNEFMTQVFKTLLTPRSSMGGYMTLPVHGVIVQSYQEAAKMTIDKLILPGSFDQEGTLLGRYASKMSTRWSKVVYPELQSILSGATIASAEDREELGKFLKSLEPGTITERSWVYLPKLKTPEAQAVFVKMSQVIENFAQPATMTQQVTISDIAMDIYSHHLSIARENADLEYAKSASEVFEKYGRSLENAYREISTKAESERTETEKYFLSKYKDYAAMVNLTFPTTFQDDAMHNDISLPTDKTKPRYIQSMGTFNGFFNAVKNAASTNEAAARVYESMKAKFCQEKDGEFVLRSNLTLNEMGRLFEEFRLENLADLNEILAAKIGVDAWDKFSRHGELLYFLYFYGVGIGLHPQKIDRTVPNAKTAGQGMNLERAGFVNSMRDAHVGVLPGHSANLVYAMKRMARYAEDAVMVINNPMTVAGDEFGDDGKPVTSLAYVYGNAQVTWTQNTQAGLGTEGRYTTSYGKFLGILKSVSTLLTPGEDSGAVYGELAYFSLGYQPNPNTPGSRFSNDFFLHWGRPNTKIVYTEQRYSMNVARYVPESMTMVDDSQRLGWDRKLTNNLLGMHYMNSFSAIILTTIFRTLVLFSSFAYLMPFWISLLISFTLAQATSAGLFVTNIFNTGNLFKGFKNSFRDLVRGFPFWSYLQPLMAEGVVGAIGKEFYNFIATYKDRKLSEANVKERYDATNGKWGLVGYVFGGIYIVAVIAFTLSTSAPLVSIPRAILVDIPFILTSMGWLDGKNAYGAYVQKDGSVSDSKHGYFYRTAFTNLVFQVFYAGAYIVDLLLGVVGVKTSVSKKVLFQIKSAFDKSEQKITYSAFTTASMITRFRTLDDMSKSIMLENFDFDGLNNKLTSAGFTAFRTVSTINELEEALVEVMSLRSEQEREIIRNHVISVLNNIIRNADNVEFRKSFLNLLEEKDNFKLGSWLKTLPVSLQTQIFNKFKAGFASMGDNLGVSDITTLTLDEFISLLDAKANNDKLWKYFAGILRGMKVTDEDEKEFNKEFIIIATMLQSLGSLTGNAKKNLYNGFFDFGFSGDRRQLVSTTIRNMFKIDIKDSFKYNLLRTFDEKGGIALGKFIREKHAFAAVSIVAIGVGFILSSGFTTPMMIVGAIAALIMMITSISNAIAVRKLVTPTMVFSILAIGASIFAGIIGATTFIPLIIIGLTIIFNIISKNLNVRAAKLAAIKAKEEAKAAADAAAKESKEARADKAAAEAKAEEERLARIEQQKQLKAKKAEVADAARKAKNSQWTTNKNDQHKQADALVKSANDMDFEQAMKAYEQAISLYAQAVDAYTKSAKEQALATQAANLEQARLFEQQQQAKDLKAMKAKVAEAERKAKTSQWTAKNAQHRQADVW